jgi:hypothetical protein
MRLWEAKPAGETKPISWRDYETIGFIIMTVIDS